MRFRTRIYIALSGAASRRYQTAGAYGIESVQEKADMGMHRCEPASVRFVMGDDSFRVLGLSGNPSSKRELSEADPKLDHETF